MTRLGLTASLAALLATLLSAGPVHAQRFTCPTRGGDIVFGQEANVNSLDQMSSSTPRPATSR
jgi:peptide/nickel transport system substrate-binding protein